MTDNGTSLAGVEPAGLAKTTDARQDWHALREQARDLVASGFLPKAINTPEKAIALMQTGRELGIAPMQALRSIAIIDGKPVLAAELMAGLVHRKLPHALLKVAKTDDKECVVLAARPGETPASEYRFTLADAQRAGLLGKSNWKSYPRAMLRSRAIAEACRGTFPDCVLGVYDADELGAITDEHGSIVQMPEVLGSPTPSVTVTSAPVPESSASADVLRAIDYALSVEALKALWPQVQRLKTDRLCPPDTYKLVVSEYKHRGELLLEQQENPDMADEDPAEDAPEPGSDG